MFSQWIVQTSLAKALEKLVKPICELCLGVLPCFGRNFLPLLALECWDDDSCSFMWKLGPTFKNSQFDEEINRRCQKKCL